VRRYEEVCEHDGHTCSVGWIKAVALQNHEYAVSDLKNRGRYDTIQDGCSYVLQIYHSKGKDSKWEDYLVAKRSNLFHGNVGLWTCRPLPAGMTIGYYIGPTVWASNVAGGKKPHPAKYDKMIPHSPDCIYEQELRNNEGRCVVVAPKPPFSVLTKDESGENTEVKLQDTNKLPHLFMGMHLMNSAREIFTDRTPYSERKIKVTVEEDGACLLNSPVEANQELFMCYSGGMPKSRAMLENNYDPADDGGEGNGGGNDSDGDEDEDDDDEDYHYDRGEGAKQRKRTSKTSRKARAKDISRSKGQENIPAAEAKKKAKAKAGKKASNDKAPQKRSGKKSDSKEKKKKEKNLVQKKKKNSQGNVQKTASAKRKKHGSEGATSSKKKTRLEESSE